MSQQGKATASRARATLVVRQVKGKTTAARERRLNRKAFVGNGECNGGKGRATAVRAKKDAEASKVLSQQGTATTARAKAMSQLAKAEQAEVFKFG